MKRTPGPFLGAALAAALLVMSGCSTGATGDSADEAAGAPAEAPAVGAQADAYPVTIEHAFGETTIEQEPARVATLGWTDQDHALALGVVPVGSVKLTWGGNDAGSSDWFDARLEEVGGEAPVRYDDGDGIPVAEVAKLTPDLILATNSGLTQEDYDKLSEVAPVVAYPDAPWVTPWRDSFGMVAEALGRTDAAEEILAATEQQIEDASQTYPQLEGTSFLFAALSTADLSSVGIYGDEDPRVEILEDFGLVVPEVVDEVVADDQFYGTISAEKADTLVSDLLITYAETDTDAETFAQDKLVGRIPALKDGHVYAEADKSVGLSVTNPTPLSIPYIIDNVLPQVAAAVDGS